MSADGAPAPKGPPIDWLRVRRYIANHYELTQEQLSSVEQSLKHWVLFHFRAPKWPKRLPSWVVRVPVWEGATITLSIIEEGLRLAAAAQGLAKLLALSQGKPGPGPPAIDEAALRALCWKWFPIKVPRKVIHDEVRAVRSRALQAPKPESAVTEPQTAEPSLLTRFWPEGLPRAAPSRGLLEQQTAEAQVPDEVKAAAAEVRRQAAEEPGAPPTHPAQHGPTVKEEPTQAEPVTVESDLEQQAGTTKRVPKIRAKRDPELTKSIHAIIQVTLESPGHLTDSRAAVWKAVQPTLPQARQDDVYDLLKDRRYDRYVKRRKAESLQGRGR